MGLKIWGAGWHPRRGDSRSGNNYADMPEGQDAPLWGLRAAVKFPDIRSAESNISQELIAFCFTVPVLAIRASLFASQGVDILVTHEVRVRCLRVHAAWPAAAAGFQRLQVPSVCKSNLGFIFFCLPASLRDQLRSILPLGTGSS